MTHHASNTSVFYLWILTALQISFVVISVEVKLTSNYASQAWTGSIPVSRMQIITWLLLQLQVWQKAGLGVAVVFVLVSSFMYIHSSSLLSVR